MWCNIANCGFGLQMQWSRLEMHSFNFKWFLQMCQTNYFTVFKIYRPYYSRCDVDENLWCKLLDIFGVLNILHKISPQNDSSFDFLLSSASRFLKSFFFAGRTADLLPWPLQQLFPASLCHLTLPHNLPQTVKSSARMRCKQNITCNLQYINET